MKKDMSELVIDVRKTSSYSRAKNLVEEYYTDTNKPFFSIPVTRDFFLMDLTLSFIELYCKDKFDGDFKCIPCYTMYKVFIYSEEILMRNTVTFEVPYESHTSYAEPLGKLNADIPPSGYMGVFVCNNVYNLSALVVIEIDEENLFKKILKKINDLKFKIRYDKGLKELFAEMAERKWDCYTFTQCTPEVFVKEFNSFFFFASKEELIEKGYAEPVCLSRPKIFISYCHDDKKIVYRIINKIKNSGTDIWLDKKDLQSGENLLRSIMSGINSCDIAMTFASKSMITSNYAQAELNQILSAMTNKKNKWCFIRLDDVNVEDIYPGLNSYCYIDYSSPKDDELIIRDLFRKLD